MTPRRIPPASCGTVITAGKQSVGRGRVRRPLTHSAHVESDGVRATRTRRRTPDSAASRPARTRRKVEILQANSWGFRKIFSLRPPLKIPERLHHVPSMPFNSLSRSRSNPERPPSPGLENTWAPVQAQWPFLVELKPCGMQVLLVLAKQDFLFLRRKA